MSGQYATVGDERDEIPAPSPQNQELILEAWHEVLGRVLHDRDTAWKEKVRVMAAESTAAIAELRAAAAPDLAMLVVAARQLRLSLTAS